VHTGRIGHPLNHEGRLPLVGVSDIAANESVRTPGDTYLPMPRPEVLSTKQVKALVRLHVESAVKAIELGFDGVEIHAAHGFLAEQFLHPEINNREDEYGGNMENRSRFLLEIIEQASSAIGKERIGVRLSPFAVVNDLPLYEEELMTHQYLLDALQRLDILFVHLSNQVSNGKSTIPLPYLRDVRERFQNLVLFTGGNSITSATKLLEDGLIDLAGFGKPFIANPDLVKRVRYGYPFATGDEATFYHGGDKGYIDYGAFSS
jgi:N-ethylmaleimide reductase